MEWGQDLLGAGPGCFLPGPAVLCCPLAKHLLGFRLMYFYKSCLLTWCLNALLVDNCENEETIPSAAPWLFRSGFSALSPACALRLRSFDCLRGVNYESPTCRPVHLIGAHLFSGAEELVPEPGKLLRGDHHLYIRWKVTEGALTLWKGPAAWDAKAEADSGVSGGRGIHWSQSPPPGCVLSLYVALLTTLRCW